MTRHEQWTRAGDVVENAKQCAITVVGVLVAAAVGCVSGVTAFLFLLSLAGKALS